MKAIDVSICVIIYLTTSVCQGFLHCVVSLKDAYYSRHEVKLRFMNAMHSIAKVTGGVVATAFDLSGFKTACDLGGNYSA